MQNHRAKKSTPNVTATGSQRVLVATTAMLVFISFWRAAAVVLNDMGSSAFYAGALLNTLSGKLASGIPRRMRSGRRQSGLRH